MRFTASVSFLNKTKLRQTLCQIPDGAEVIIDGDAASHIDHDILELVEDFKHAAKYRGITVELRRMDHKSQPLRLTGA